MPGAAEPTQPDVGSAAAGSLNSLLILKISLLMDTGIFCQERAKTAENEAANSASIGPYRGKSLQISLQAGNIPLDTAYRATVSRTISI